MTPAPAGADRRAIWSWCFYDFANSAFTTLIVTFIYATYFTSAIAKDGGTLWSRGASLTALVVAALSPLLGAIADRGGKRRAFLFVSTVLAVGAGVGLYAVGDTRPVIALAIFVVGNVAFEMGLVFYNAFLPEIAPPGKIGRISGNGWALGYVGGLLALVVALVGFVQPDEPWFGFAKDGSHIRATCLLVAVWFAVFSAPMFLFVREKRSTATAPVGRMVSEGYRQLIATFHDIRRYRQIVNFLIARLIYNDALVTVFAFGGIYAAGTFGFTMQQILVFGIVLNVAAGAGAWALGHLDDRLGGKRTIQLSLVGLGVATILALVSTSTTVFWIAGILIGIFSGPNQSASRSLMGRFVPPDKENEFFGFFAFSGKATAFLGPFLFGLLTDIFGSQRAGLSVVLALLLLGAVLLVRVDEEEGTRLGQTGVPAE